MVTIHSPEMTQTKERFIPIMPRHRIEATRDTRTFNKGDVAECFIARMSDGRFMVMDDSFASVTIHYEVHTEKSLHESFTEL
jgi:hypothetical protein